MAPVTVPLSVLQRRVLLVPLALSALTMAGWLLRVDMLVTHGTSNPMVFNTAVCLMLCALSLALPQGQARFAIVCATLASLIGLLTLWQYWSGVSLGIDTLLMTPHVVAATLVPGRMAWHTALGLTFAGAAAAILRLPLRDAWRSAGAGIGGSLVLAVTLFVLAGGVVVQGGVMDWSAWTSVAPGTAVSLLCLGTVQLWAARAAHPTDRLVRWAPVAVLLAVVTTGGLLWNWLSAAETRATQRALSSVAREVVDAARVEINGVRGAQLRMAERWRLAGRTPAAVWDADARSYVKTLGLAFHWRIARDGAAHVVAREGMTPGPALRQAVARLCATHDDGSPWSARTLDADRTLYAIGIAPLKSADADECLIVATPWSEILQRALPVETPVSVTLAIDGRPRLSAGPPAASEAPAVRRSLDLGSIDLTFTASPAFLALHRTWTAELALFVFVVFGALAAGALRQGQMASDHQAALLAAAEATAAARAQAAIVLENAGQGFWDWNIGTGEVTLDGTWHRILGYTPGEVVDVLDTWKRSLHPDDAEAADSMLERHLASDEARYDVDCRIRKKDGSWTWVNARGRVQARDAQGRAVRMIGTLQDVSERKRLEQATLASLTEKETLLREIHHRVKNNLAVMSSLFYFQAQEASDPAVARVFQDSQDRTRSMAMVHELLYQSADLSRIDFSEYLQRLVGHLRDTHGRVWATALHLDPMQLDVDTAVPCGLIVNELVTNAFKYAFTGRDAGRVQVGLHVVEGRAVVTVTDNGVGLPEGTDPATCRTLGLRLVRSLTAQIDGTITFLNARPGTEARLEFPVKQPTISLPPLGAEVHA